MTEEDGRLFAPSAQARPEHPPGRLRADPRRVQQAPDGARREQRREAERANGDPHRERASRHLRRGEGHRDRGAQRREGVHVPHRTKRATWPSATPTRALSPRPRAAPQTAHAEGRRGWQPPGTRLPAPHVTVASSMRVIHESRCITRQGAPVYFPRFARRAGFFAARFLAAFRAAGRFAFEGAFLPDTRFGAFLAAAFFLAGRAARFPKYFVIGAK